LVHGLLFVLPFDLVVDFLILGIALSVLRYPNQYSG
jgi:hypothetical protein